MDVIIVSASSVLSDSAGTQELGETMRYRLFEKSAAILAAVVLLIGCSTNPAKKKARLLDTGRVYLDKGKYQEASVEFRKALQIDPNFAQAHYQLAREYLLARAWFAAYKELTTTVKLDPKNIDAQVDLATLLIGVGKFDLAQGQVEKILGVDANRAAAFVLVGQKYAAAHDTDRAVEDFEKAIKLEPTNANNYIGLAAVYLGAHRNSEAEANYKKATEVDPKSFQAQLAVTYPPAKPEALETVSRSKRLGGGR
jgi:Tfp pilus assembly protein PilF